MKRFRAYMMALLLLMAVPAWGRADSGDPRALRDQIEHALEHMQLYQAAVLVQDEPLLKYRVFYQSRIGFLKFLAVEDPALLPLFIDFTEGAIKDLKKLPSSDPDKDALLAEIYFLRGTAKILNKRMVSSVLDLKTSCNLIYRNSLEFPENVTQNKLLGVFNVSMAIIPKKLKWLSNALCFKGDLNRGIRQLELAGQQSPFLKNEATIILYYFEKNLFTQPAKAHARARVLEQRYPQSVLYSYLYLASLIENHQNDEALAYAARKEPQFEQLPGVQMLPQWYYTRGKAHFFKLEYQACIRQLDRFLAGSRSRTLYADALYRKGIALTLSGRYPEARRVFHDLTRVEASSFDQDEYAAQMASVYLLQEPSEEDKDLYRARNLYDGGYYAEALRYLEPLAARAGQLSQNQQTELYYRQGRIQQSQGQQDAAAMSYLRCQDTEPGKNLWMKVYALFYLGQVAEAQGQPEAAREHYKAALKFDDYAYQAGLEQRCKAALQQLDHPQ